MKGLKIFSVIFIFSLCITTASSIAGLYHIPYIDTPEVPDGRNMTKEVREQTGSTPTNLGEAIFNNYIWVSKIAGFLFNLLTGNYGLWLALGIPVPYAMLLSSATWLSYLITLIEIFK